MPSDTPPNDPATTSPDYKWRLRDWLALIPAALAAFAVVYALGSPKADMLPTSFFVAFFILGSYCPLRRIIQIMRTMPPEPGVCARCRYELRGLPEQSPCPECGARGAEP